MYSAPPMRFSRTDSSTPSRRPLRVERPRSRTSRANRVLGTASHNPCFSARARTVARKTRVCSLLSKASSTSAPAPVGALSVGSRKNRSVLPSTSCRCLRSCSTSSKRCRNKIVFFASIPSPRGTSTTYRLYPWVPRRPIRRGWGELRAFMRVFHATPQPS